MNKPPLIDQDRNIYEADVWKHASLRIFSQARILHFNISHKETGNESTLCKIPL